MKLYRFPLSTNVERVALALAHKNLEAESVEISREDRTLVRDVSGQDLVPVLIDGETVVCDSVRILNYLEERYPDPPLFPKDSARREEMGIFIEWFNRVWKQAPNRIFDELEKSNPNQDVIVRFAEEFKDSLDRFQILLSDRDYLFGECSAADCVAFPFVKYALLSADHSPHRFHKILAEYQVLEDKHVDLAAWIKRMNQRPRK